MSPGIPSHPRFRCALLVLGTYRDDELSTSHALVDTLAAQRRLDGVSRIDLTGLDDTGVMALMESAAGHQSGTERSRGTGPRHLPRDRRQSVLRERGAPQPGGNGSHPTEHVGGSPKPPSM